MMIDLTGQRYGKLTVIREIPERLRNEIAYECKCSCGKITLATRGQLLRGVKKSCGCLRKRTPTNALDLTGREFGKLKVVGRDGTNKNGQALWLCECECGNKKSFTATALRRGDAKSCGCARPEQGRNVKRILETEKTIDGVQVPLLTKKTRSDSRSGHKGVHMRIRNGRIYYEANITVKGRRIWGPTRNTLAEAINDRKAFEDQYHKPYIEALEERTHEGN